MIYYHFDEDPWGDELLIASEPIYELVDKIEHHAKAIGTKLQFTLENLID